MKRVRKFNARLDKHLQKNFAFTNNHYAGHGQERGGLQDRSSPRYRGSEGHADTQAVPPDQLVFRSESGGPLLETTILSDGLHPALKALGLPKGGLHAFRRGCNRRWELAGINPAVIRQQMGHSSARMTVLYSGEIPIDQVVAEYSKTSKSGNRIDVLENVENEAAA